MREAITTVMLLASIATIAYTIPALARHYAGRKEGQ